MMDHILELDWSASSADTRPYLVSEKALDNCCIEKIIKQKFHDPLLSSEEEDNEPNNINWDAVFQNRDVDNTSKIHVPGLRPWCPNPKLSVLTGPQHYQCLKVLSVKNPHILPEQHFNKANSYDFRVFETLSEFYEQEQKEFIEWANSLWPKLHCSRAIRLESIVETVYEKQFQKQAQRVSSYPKNFDMAAQIPLESNKRFTYEAVCLETLVSENVSELPLATIPASILEYTSIIKSCPLPEPCYKHPYHFVLPKEDSVSMLPIVEIHRELAQYAADNGTRLIASEGALRCLLAFKSTWTIPISVHSVITPDGSTCNVVVLDSEFTMEKDPAMVRTFKAYRHLLYHHFVPSSEIEKTKEKIKEKKVSEKKDMSTVINTSREDDDLSSDDEALIIHEEYVEDDSEMKDPKDNETQEKQSEEQGRDNHQNKEEITEDTSPAIKNTTVLSADISVAEINDIVGAYNCTCTDTLFEVPPCRSYKKWRLSNVTALDTLEVIIHSAHKARMDKSKELILEPIPEYQLEIGGCEQSMDRIRSIALALMLRDNSTVLNVRVDGCNGEIVSMEPVTSEEFKSSYPQTNQQILNVIQNTLSDLQGLMPGHYVLQHEPSHGVNALLYVARPNGSSLNLNFDISLLKELDEAKVVATPPTIGPALLPFHKFRKILPCAFAPYSYQLAKEPKKPPPKPEPVKIIKKRTRKRNRKSRK